MVVDIGIVRNYIKPKADSTLYNMRKVDLIEYIRTLEHNYNVAVSFNENQAKYIESLGFNGGVVQEWISASEPPKKITNKVIVLCKNGYMGYGHYEDYKGERTWYNLESGKPFTDWDLEDCESYEVTHWMPLPPAPEDMK